MISIYLTLLDTQNDKIDLHNFTTNTRICYIGLPLKKQTVSKMQKNVFRKHFFYLAQNFDKIDDINSKRTKCYLSTIVSGFAIDIFNISKKADKISLENGISELELSVFDNYDKIDLLSAFDNILDDESKIYMYLKYIYGYKSKEIANIYKVNDTYVRKKIQYAKIKLKRKLTEV